MNHSQSSIALIAQHGREADLLQWWRFNAELLSAFTIYTNLAPSAERPQHGEIHTIASGEDGGEMKAGALIADGEISKLIYFWNPRAVVAFDSDAKALIRMAVHHGVVLACNRASADHLVASARLNPAGYFPETARGQKRVALVAHDGEKAKMVQWCQEHRERLAPHVLIGTGTTAARISAETGLSVEGLRSGPDGGDFQLGARIVEQDLDYLMFFWSTRDAQPHEADVKALLRIAVQWNIPVACNVATASRIIESHLFDGAAALPAEAAVASRLSA